MPQRIYYEEPYEQAVREEGERLMDMYDQGSGAYQLGVAILRVLEEKKSAERALRKAQSNPTTHAPDGETSAAILFDVDEAIEKVRERYGLPPRRR